MEGDCNRLSSEWMARAVEDCRGGLGGHDGVFERRVVVVGFVFNDVEPLAGGGGGGGGKGGEGGVVVAG